MGIQENVFNLRMVSKQFARLATKAERDAEKEKLKVKQAIEKGNIDGGRIFAQNVIRKKNEALNFLRLSARMDAVAGRLDTAAKMNAVGRNMGMVVKNMDAVLKTMDMDKIAGVMDKFEQQFVDVDVANAYMESTMSQTTALTTPEEEVGQLMAEIADQHGLQFGTQQVVSNTPVGQLEQIQQDELSARLERLKKPPPTQAL